jgi:hypothetical protein
METMRWALATIAETLEPPESPPSRRRRNSGTRIGGTRRSDGRMGGADG